MLWPNILDMFSFFFILHLYSPQFNICFFCTSLASSPGHAKVTLLGPPVLCHPTGWVRWRRNFRWRKGQGLKWSEMYLLSVFIYLYSRPNSGVAAAGKLQILAVFTICTPTKFVLLWGPWKENAPLLLLDVVCRFNTVQNHWGLLEKHPSWFGRSWSWTTESSQSGAYGMKEWQGFARDQSCPVIVGLSQHPYLVRQ